MSWVKVRLGDILTESKIICENPNPDRRIKVKLKVLGVEKRGLENEIEGATKQFIRKSGQFIYGKQNFHKGAFGIIPVELDGYESSADLPAFDVASNCLPEWVFFFFKQGNYYLQLSKIARGVATQRIHPEQIFNLEIPLPDIKTQKLIISKIKTAENKGTEITNNISYQLSLVSQLRQSFLREAMQGKLLPQNHSDGNAKDLLADIISEKVKLGIKEKPLPPIKPKDIPFNIPEKWIWIKLSNIFKFIDYRGKTPTRTIEGVRLISAKNIRFGYIDNNPIEFISSSEYEKWMVRGFPQNGDILFVTEGHTMGFVAIINLDFKYVLAQRTICLQPIIYGYSKFIYYYLMSPLTQKIIKNLATGAAAMGIKSAKLKELLVTLPPLPEQHRIVAKLDQLMQTCDALEASIKQSKEENEKLLQQVLREALSNN